MKTQYIDDIWTASVGGDEEATSIRLEGGALLLLAFDQIGLYASEDAYWEGEVPLLMREIPEIPAWTERQAP